MRPLPRSQKAEYPGE